MLDIAIGHESFAAIAEKYNEMHRDEDNYFPESVTDDKENENDNSYDEDNSEVGGQIKPRKALTEKKSFRGLLPLHDP